MKLLGILLAILGVITMVFGGIGLAIYYIHDLIVNFDSLSSSEIFWHVVGLVLRDLLAIIVGVVLFVLGSAMADR